jgi:outer membrane protein OmpA-like peptidoglycan-associated protein
MIARSVWLASGNALIEALRSIGLLIVGFLGLVLHSQLANAFNPYEALFVIGSAEISPAGRAVIDLVIADAKRTPTARIVLTGHTDRVGPENYNLRLSLRRAEAVRDALIAGGVPAELIAVEGRGESENAIPTADGQPEQANRRVVIIFPDFVPEAAPALPAQ